MLKPTKIKLKNFGKHALFEAPLEAGTTALFGPNGSGKSLIVGGIVYALTGWVDPAWGSQKKLQKDGEAVPGYAKMEFEADGEQYTVSRYVLTGGKNTDCLYKGTELIANRRTTVNDAIQIFTGVECTLLAQLVWCRQEALTWLLTSPPNVINPILAMLFDCSKLEKIRDALKKAYDGIAHLRSDSKEIYEAAKNQFSSVLPNTLEEHIQSLQQEEDTLIEELKSCNVTGIQAEIKQANLEQIKQQIIQAELALKINKAKPEPRKPDLSEEELKAKHTEITRQISQWQASNIVDKGQVDSYKVMLDRIIAIKVPHKCALCSSTITDKDAYKNKYIKEITNGEYTDSSAVEDLKTRIDDTEAMISQTNDKLDYLVEQLNTVEADETACRAHANWTASEISRKAQQQIAENNLTVLRKELKETEAIPVIAEDAVSKQKQLEGVRSMKKAVSEELIEAKTIQATATKTMEQAIADGKAYKKNEAARTILTDLRACLSTTRAQSKYLKHKIRQLNDQIAAYLVRTDMPFTLWLDEDEHLFKYRMLEAGAEDHVASMLSGAQKAISALIIQLSILSVCDVQCKLCLFDEVDAALSQENKQAIVSLQESLVADPEARLIFISQSQTLIDNCSNSISLG